MIEARGLVQTFQTRQGRQKREVRAVDGVDLDVAEGEVVGFLGPNGAGKTTTLRMLTTLLRPTSGSARVAGHDVVTESEQVRRAIGYVSQSGGTFSGARAGEEREPHIASMRQVEPASALLEAAHIRKHAPRVTGQWTITGSLGWRSSPWGAPLTTMSEPSSSTMSCTLRPAISPL